MVSRPLYLYNVLSFFLDNIYDVEATEAGVEATEASASAVASSSSAVDSVSRPPPLVPKWIRDVEVYRSQLTVYDKDFLTLDNL